MTSLFWPARSLANGLGLAWWARVETRDPDVTYWFGPYVRRASLEAACQAVVVVRARRSEPLTIQAQG